MTSVAITGEVVERPVLVIEAPDTRYITETATGLRFHPETPIEVWSRVVERLQHQHKRIEWALGDALQFGERAYGDMYAQWAEETGLSENTLATIKWVAGKIESSRRRNDVGWSHHREVAGLDDPQAQDRLLEAAAEKGMTRWELRQHVKAEKERTWGRAVTVEGEPEPAPDLPLSAADLTDEARQALEYRAAGVGKRHRQGFEAGWVAALAWNEARDCFTRWPE